MEHKEYKKRNKGGRPQKGNGGKAELSYWRENGGSRLLLLADTGA